MKDRLRSRIQRINHRSPRQPPVGSSKGDSPSTVTSNNSRKVNIFPWNDMPTYYSNIGSAGVGVWTRGCIEGRRRSKRSWVVVVVGRVLRVMMFRRVPALPLRGRVPAILKNFEFEFMLPSRYVLYKWSSLTKLSFSSL
jgi:hypothetical protein